MTNSLREQLLKAGFTSKPKPSTKGAGASGKRKGKGKPRRAGGGEPASSAETDLARAYALRAKAESAERRAQKAQAEREARERKERKRKLQEALEGAVLNKPDAELMRHFEYGGKIRRVHVDADQLAAINAGELVVVQQGGRYLLVSPQTADAIAAFAPDHIALRVDPSTAGQDEDGVPDDLVW